MSFHSTACFPPTANWKPRGRNYGDKCGPSHGPGSGNTKFERTVGLLGRPHSKEAHSGRRQGLPRCVSDMGHTIQGWAPADQPDYDKWCAFWKTAPVRPEDPPPPDLTPTKLLYDTMQVNEAESNFRRDVHEDNHWRTIHQNQKPEKLLRAQAGSVAGNSPVHIEAHSTIPKIKPQDFWEADAIKHDTNLMRNTNWCNLNRPKRLEPTGSLQSVWTPRVRPKTPLPVQIRQRGTEQRQTVVIPPQNERDAMDPRGLQQVQHQAFGFKDPTHSFALIDPKKAREYERFSDLYNDKYTHSRNKYDPKAKFVDPVTSAQEMGWQCSDPDVYKPICGDSPSKIDFINGLTRVSFAGGTPARLCSPMSKFIDNVLMTRPDFNAF